MLDRILVDGIDTVPREVFPDGTPPEGDFDARWEVSRIINDHDGDVEAAKEAVWSSRVAAMERLTDLERQLVDLKAHKKGLIEEERDIWRTLAAQPLLGVFLIDNVAEYVFARPFPNLTEFPPITPPRPVSWMEWKSREEGGFREGALVSSSRTDNGWKVQVDTFVENRRKEVIGPWARLTVNLDRRGKIASSEWDEDRYGPVGEDGHVPSIVVTLQALAFLHCHNVETDPAEAPSEKLARRFRQRHGIDPTRYSTIRLKVPRRVGQHGEGEGSSGKALHIVDGHFAHYGACCGDHQPKGLLFGKYEGVYWVESHARGIAERGVVVRDRVMVTGTA